MVLAAGDTFRAAAIEQLKIWGGRTGAKVIASDAGVGPRKHSASRRSAPRKADGADIVIMDTAGRLQNRAELMAELEKIVRVMKKVDASAPHAVLLVLDATVGQNALSQAAEFTRIAGVTGLVMTKLDGTARGGILVALAAKRKLPVHFIGVGEGVDDLDDFRREGFRRTRSRGSSGMHALSRPALIAGGIRRACAMTHAQAHDAATTTISLAARHPPPTLHPANDRLPPKSRSTRSSSSCSKWGR